jgi:hypothetical protein
MDSQAIENFWSKISFGIKFFIATSLLFAFVSIFLQEFFVELPNNLERTV